MKKYILICLTFLLPFAGIGQDKLKVTVHPGVELFTIVQILANKYPQPNPSAYTTEAMAYFGKYKDHPAVKMAASLKKTYTDLVELGWCMSDFPQIKIYEPDDISWYKMNGKDNTLQYMRLCRDFFYDTHFWDFFQQHQQRYDKWGNDLKAKVDSGKLADKLEGFYKFRSDVKWFVCIDPLNSWGSHAIMTKTLNPQFADWVVYNTGFFNENAPKDADPVFEFKGFENLVWHEGSHVYIESLFKKYKNEIDALSYLYNKDDEGMLRNNISNWTYCLNENIVRSVVGALYHKYRTERQYKRQVARETAADFIYVADLEPFIYNKYLITNKYKSFEEFFPEILKFLKKKYPVKA